MKQLGKYELHEQLGRGGFGTVYRAIDTSLHREVALKVLHPQLTTDPDFLEKFRNEARLVASLRSPNIVTIHDLGEADGRVFIAMEYLSGGSLKQKLEEEGSLSFENARKILEQVCNGLSEAHEQGLVHRDIKPGNILFDGKGNAILGDFGLARAMQLSSTTAASRTGGVGTPAYRAPELWLGKPPASPATDIYALGCVLTEMLTGKVLFDGDSTDVVITQHLVQGPQIPEKYSEEVQSVLKKVFAKNPEERYQTVDMFSRSIIEAFDTETQEKNEQEQLTNELEHTALPLIPELRTKPKPALANSPNPQVRPIGRQAVAFWGIVALLILVIGGVSGWFKLNTTRVPVAIEAPAATEAPIVLTEAPVATEAPIANETAEPAAGTIQISPKDGMPMVYVPAGEFTMGSSSGEGDDDEHPEHQVYLSGYWIDQTEVTNRMYEQCVNDGGCTLPRHFSFKTHDSYYGNNHYDDYPVIYVDWNQANEYCAWTGRVLPTEAQWEKAARGTDGRIYSWGNNSPTSSLANYDQNVGETIKVGSYPVGASPYGVLDIAGNVWEWVADWYNPSYYSQSPVNNPTGPTSGNDRVLRGGSWFNPTVVIRSANRYWSRSMEADSPYGFRCAINVSKSS